MKAILLVTVMMVFSLHAAKVEDPFFLISAIDTDVETGSVLRMDPETYDMSAITFSDTLYFPLALTFDSAEDTIYWGENAGSFTRIRGASIDGGGMRRVYQFEQDSAIGGLAVDVEERLIFYTKINSSVVGKLKISDSDSYPNEIIISSDLVEPLPIVLNTRDRVVFWGDRKGDRKIERANYDGSGRRTIIQSGLHTLNGLALDVHNNELYWVDGDTDKVERSDMDGNFRTVLFTGSSDYHSFGLALFERSLYYTDWGTHRGIVGKSHMFRLKLDESNAVPYTVASSDHRLGAVFAYTGCSESLARATFPWSTVLAAFVVIATIIG